MATHPSALVWRIPRTEEPGGLQSIESQSQTQLKQLSAHICMPAGLDEAQAGIKIAGRTINNLRHADDTSPTAESKELKSLLKEDSEKGGLELNIQETKIMASSLITSWRVDRKPWKQCQTLFFWTPESLQMVTAAMKLKDTCSLEEKL